MNQDAGHEGRIAAMAVQACHLFDMWTVEGEPDVARGAKAVEWMMAVMRDYVLGCVDGYVRGYLAGLKSPRDNGTVQ